MGKPKRKLSAYNRYMSKALKGKMTGKTKAQRKAIFKAAAKGWNKGKSTPRSSKPKSRATTSRSNATGGTRQMPKNSFNMSKIYSLANKVAFVAPYAGIALDPTHSPLWKVNRGIAYLSGYDMLANTWDFENLKKGWLPYVATKIVTAVVPKITSFVKGLL